MEEKIVLMSKITFENAEKIAYDKVSDDLAMIVAKNKMTMNQGIMTTMLITKYTDIMKKEIFGGNENETNDN